MASNKLHNLALVCVVGFTAYAALASQVAMNNSNADQECTEFTVIQALSSLDKRTTLSTKGVTTNIQLQQAQAKFLTVVQSPKTTEQARREAFLEYFRALNRFVESGKDTIIIAKENPFPKETAYRECLNKKDGWL